MWQISQQALKEHRHTDASADGFKNFKTLTVTDLFVMECIMFFKIFEEWMFEIMTQSAIRHDMSYALLKQLSAKYKTVHITI